MGLIQYLFKKEETIESLIDDCEHKYQDFLSYITKAHYRSYVTFKIQLKHNMDCLYQQIAEEPSLEIRTALLKHLKSQLTFINKHPFSATQKEISLFINAHHPYQEKINELILQYTPQPTSNKPKF